MPTLFVATGNRDKLRELLTLLEIPGLTLVTPADLPTIPPPEETEETFAANARLKALAYAFHTDLITLADDSGLEVDALGGKPGVHSARFAGRQGDDAANLARLLTLMDSVEDPDRSAHFTCAVAVASRQTILAEACGRVDGFILARPRGKHGFGYDPVFFYPPANATFAELESDRKNRVSHRARALTAVAPRLRQLLDTRPFPPVMES